MWQTLVQLLFTATFILQSYQTSHTQKENLLRLWRTTFKQFMIIPKRTSSKLVDEMINKNFSELALMTKDNSLALWECRRNYKYPEKRIKNEKKPNPLKGVPNTWCQILKEQYKICSICYKEGQLATAWHLKYTHGIFTENPWIIWRKKIASTNTSSKNNAHQTNRKKIIAKLTSMLNNYLQACKKSTESLQKNSTKPKAIFIKEFSASS